MESEIKKELKTLANTHMGINKQKLVDLISWCDYMEIQMKD